MWPRKDEELDALDPQRLLMGPGEHAAVRAADMGRALARFRRALRKGGFSRNEAYSMSCKLFENLLQDWTSS